MRSQRGKKLCRSTMETDHHSMCLISTKEMEKRVWGWEVGDRVITSRRLEGVKMLTVRNNAGKTWREKGAVWEFARWVFLFATEGHCFKQDKHTGLVWEQQQQQLLITVVKRLIYQAAPGLLIWAHCVCAQIQFNLPSYENCCVHTGFNSARWGWRSERQQDSAPTNAAGCCTIIDLPVRLYSAASFISSLCKYQVPDEQETVVQCWRGTCGKKVTAAHEMYFRLWLKGEENRNEMGYIWVIKHHEKHI